MKPETKHLYSIVQHLIVAMGYQADNFANMMAGNTVFNQKDEFLKLIHDLQLRANEIEIEDKQ